MGEEPQNPPLRSHIYDERTPAGMTHLGYEPFRSGGDGFASGEGDVDLFGIALFGNFGDVGRCGRDEIVVKNRWGTPHVGLIAASIAT